jgi:hypothetical protein
MGNGRLGVYAASALAALSLACESHNDAVFHKRYADNSGDNPPGMVDVHYRVNGSKTNIVEWSVVVGEPEPLIFVHYDAATDSYAVNMNEGTRLKIKRQGKEAGEVRDPDEWVKEMAGKSADFCLKHGYAVDDRIHTPI